MEGKRICRLLPIVLRIWRVKDLSIIASKCLGLMVKDDFRFQLKYMILDGIVVHRVCAAYV